MALVRYRVEISALLKSDPGNGFVDNQRLEDYRTGGSPTEAADLDKAIEKERANLRWREIRQQVATHIAPVGILAFDAPGADANTPPSSFAFTLVYDRPDYVYAYDETDAPTVLHDEDAVKRLVARALIADITTSTIVLDPTPVADTPHSSAYGESVQVVTAGKIADDLAEAEAAITVTKLADQ